MKWISVKDDLPKEGKFVALIGDELIFGEVFKGIFTPGFQYGEKLVYFLINGQYHLGQWVKPRYFGEITHWFPLPLIPFSRDCWLPLPKVPDEMD